MKITQNLTTLMELSQLYTLKLITGLTENQVENLQTLQKIVTSKEGV